MGMLLFGTALRLELMLSICLRYPSFTQVRFVLLSCYNYSTSFSAQDRQSHPLSHFVKQECRWRVHEDHC